MDTAEKSAAARAAFNATFADVATLRPEEESETSSEDESDRLAHKPIGPPSSAKCTAAGAGVAGGEAGSMTSFTVVMKDEDGRRIMKGGAHVAVRVVPGLGVVGGEQLAAVKDGEDGTYTATYTVHSRGNYTLHVTCNGDPIMGSPFPVFFSAGTAAANGGLTAGSGVVAASTAPLIATPPLLPSALSPFPNLMQRAVPGVTAGLIPNLTGMAGMVGMAGLPLTSPYAGMSGGVLPGSGENHGTDVRQDELNDVM